MNTFGCELIVIWSYNACSGCSLCSQRVVLDYVHWFEGLRSAYDATSQQEVDRLLLADGSMAGRSTRSWRDPLNTGPVVDCLCSVARTMANSTV